MVAISQASFSIGEYDWEPILFFAADPNAKARIATLQQTNRIHRVFDTIEQQIDDLANARNPHFKKDTRNPNKKHLDITKGANLEDYGVWIYYPWNSNLVHLLPEEEFTELRLDRNRPKITADEQQKLIKNNLGIVGLSVGNAIAVTAALENVCGHFKLADYDFLDISNMNRLRASIQDIGIPKTVLAARQIYEINPFAKITLFSEGLQANNIDSFFTQAPQINILVDECDDISIKILLREKAKELRIPVLMETSDRGMLDIERFDLDPDRPIFHGLLGRTQSSDVPSTLSNEEKVKFVLPLIGSDSLSTRAAASMVEIEETISTWPQLASDVMLGGASVCSAIRNLTLNTNLQSGRRFIDFDKILAADPEFNTPLESEENRISVDCTKNLQRIQDLRDIPEHIRFIVSKAIKAPSAGNTQPWKFYFYHNALWLQHLKDRSESHLDPEYHAAYLALGAAIENCQLAAQYRGYSSSVEWLQESENNLIAKIEMETEKTTIEYSHELYNQIDFRITNRQAPLTKPVDQQDIQSLCTLASVCGCNLQFIVDKHEISVLSTLVGEGERIRFLCPELHHELMNEIRWTVAQVTTTSDGIDLDTLELSGSQKAALKLLSRPSVAQFIRSQNIGNSITKISEKAIKKIPLMMLLSVKDGGRIDALQGGRTLQRIWLKAAELGMVLQPKVALTYLFDLLDTPYASIFNTTEISKLRKLLYNFNLLFDPIPNYRRSFLFGIGYISKPATSRSLRKPIEEILVLGNPKNGNNVCQHD